MAKRFIDTDLFKKPRFKELKAPYKLLWVYLMCECNHAGLWNVELDVAGLRIGQKLPDDCTTIMGHMIKVVDSGRKWWLKDFVRFQYGGELVTTNRLHASVVKELEAWGLLNDLEEIDVVERGSTVSAVRHRLSRKAKNEVLMRDELTCQYCGEQRPMAELVVDHVVPVINGGDNDNENLVACCVRCNGHKTDLSLDEFIGRGHPFLNPSEGVIKKLNAPFKPLLGAKDKDKDKDKDKKKEEEPRELKWPAFAGDKCRAKWAEFIAYRAAEKGKRYKTAESEQRALDLAVKFFPTGPGFVSGLDHAMAKTWEFPVDPAKYDYPKVEGVSAAPVILNANGKPQQLKPWVN